MNGKRQADNQAAGWSTRKRCRELRDGATQSKLTFELAWERNDGTIGAGG
ncbi:hypothetical protein [Paenibacillus sp. KS-LC4]